MPRFAANLSFLFTELPFRERFAAAAQHGFKAVEFMSADGVPTEDVRALLDRNRLELVLANGAQGDWAAGERGIAALRGREAEFDAAMAAALDDATVLGNRLIHVMAGVDKGEADGGVFVDNLTRAADHAAVHGVTLVIEPINTRDMPGYFVSRTKQALDLIAKAGRPNIGLQFDVYHRHVMEGDVEAGLAEAQSALRHIQIASPPDRGEPDKGDIDYRRLFALIDDSGYDGYVGCEYKPRAGTAPGLAWAKTLAVSLA